MKSLESADTRSFTLEGQLTNFILKRDYWLEYLQIQVDGVAYRVKPSSDLREALPRDLSIGDRVRVSGWAKRKDTGILKLQAEVLEVVSLDQPTAVSTAKKTDFSTPKTAPSKAKILVCQKPDCMKRGGHAVCAALEQTLRDRDLTDYVQIQGTGCMDRCKAGPNLVFMPDRAKYSRVSAAEITALINQHFPATES